jgi:hypothetical protein
MPHNGNLDIRTAVTAESHSKTRSLLGEFSYEMKKGNHPTPNEHDSPISPSPDPMGGIVLELTENVFGRVLRGLLPRPRLGESKLNPVRTAEPWTRRRSPDIDSTNPDPQTAQAPVGPCHGKVAEQRLGAGVERRIAIRFWRCSYRCCTFAKEPSSLAQNATDIFPHNPAVPKAGLPGNPRSAPASANTSWSHGRRRRKNKKREHREATLVARLRLKSAPSWLSCHAAAFRAHVPSSRRV